MGSKNGRVRRHPGVLKFSDQASLVEWLKSTPDGRAALQQACGSVQTVDLLAVAADGYVELFSSAYTRLKTIQRVDVTGDREAEVYEDQMLYLRLDARSRRIYDEVHRVGTVDSRSISIDQYVAGQFCEEFNRAVDRAADALQGSNNASRPR